MADRPDIVPYLSYADPAAAIDFLGRAFGLTQVVRVDDDGGDLMHAELAYGSGVVMIGKDASSANANTSRGLYLVVDDVDAHHERAKREGAEIVYGPQDTEFGTRRWRARDPEGHEWSFGTYRPQTEPPSWT